MYQPRQSWNAPSVQKHSFSARLQVVLRQGAPNPHFGLGDAARALHFSERSLQRKLQHLGTSFRAELLRTRCDMAKKLLDAGHTPQQAAWAVGYRRREHFARAFKRCQGQSPTDYKRSCRSSGDSPNSSAA